METITKKRILAFILDFLVITFFIWILNPVIYPLVIVTGIYGIFNYNLVFLAIVIMAYFTYLEKSKTSTLGKSIMGIHVEAEQGELTYHKTFIRNLSKILWFPLVLDLIGGLLLKNGYIRLLDKYAKTKVVLSMDKH
ncbi:MAG: RDD family protein [Euryarchaeota archaeon]|nr:RDD family protein [Euryarchaeota archaeon]MBV1729429.1 RDD family protein [Methanobacterium sp.]MBV1754179.1 RDD family protein [Methanobacterium sp.]MBV1768406.1 RDD family protein [Methanobacterium sp.]